MGSGLGHDVEAALAGAGALAESATGARSPAIDRFRRFLADAARHEVPVLLVGETGTGKTTFAQSLHALSPRAERPFVRVDCPAGAGDLAEHARAACMGTLFLDEVAELSPDAQSSALAIVDETCGAGRRPDVRVVASTRHDLEARIRDRTFRSDLYYRVSVIELRIPTLRERREDIVPLARAFVERAARRVGRLPPDLSPELERALHAYGWPGNITELISVMERILILTSGSVLDVAVLPQRVKG